MKTLPVLYLLKQWPDFDQTGTETSLERLLEMIRFGDFDLIFMVTMVKYD